MNKNRLIVIAGPTASGKTACAVRLCERIGGEVVSADSMQIYRGMDVLTAKPTKDEMRGIKHHLLDCVDPDQQFSAAKYRDLAKPIIEDIIARGKQPVLCGGTGLYINAVTRPMGFSEECDPALRNELKAIAETPGGRKKLHDMLADIDPEAAVRLHENDVRRVTRAIEVYRLTGKTQREQAAIDAGREGDYNEVIFAPDWPREQLYERINRRVDQMLSAGLIREVETLLADGEEHPTALQAIGYKEIAAALQGRMSMEEAIVLVKQLSRNYAKKQLTWFRRDPRVHWIEAPGKSVECITDEILRALENEKI